MKSERPIRCVAAAAALAGGALLNFALVREPTGVTGEPDAAHAAPAIRYGGVLAVVGGLRALAADLLWLEANLAWERRDAARTIALLDAVVAADGRPEYFWVNGARMIAYDMPGWLETEQQPAAWRRRTEREFAARGLEFLRRAERHLGPTAALQVEMARIGLDRMGDPLLAAEHFGRAAELPDAPDYAVRLRVALLRRAGRTAEAEAWVRDWWERRAEAMTAEQRAEWRRWLAQPDVGAPAR